MKATTVHYRTGDFTKSVNLPVACGERGFSTVDTDAVTCQLCRFTTDYQSAAAEYENVVEALAYPKEEHPCLPKHPTP